jgi:hypothetical protein
MSIKRFARINSLTKKVDNVIEANQEFINTLPDYDLWVASSVLDTKKLADKNDTYDVDNNTFTSPKPYESWTFNNTTWSWQPPVSIPNQTNEEVYVWNEENTNWEEVA